LDLRGQTGDERRAALRFEAKETLGQVGHDGGVHDLGVWVHQREVSVENSGVGQKERPRYTPGPRSAGI
jgi:hypothetical protein